jgi:excisionase family DNA binding protein
MDFTKVLSFQQGCDYLGYKKSYVYKMTMRGILPFSKPNGKKIYFDRDELESWMLRNSNSGLETGANKNKTGKGDEIEDLVFSSVLKAVKLTKLSENTIPETTNELVNG